MANVQHKDIVDPNIHEPKGVAYAPAGTAYVADGAGSGDWIEVVTPGLIGTVGSVAYSDQTLYSNKINSQNLRPLNFNPPVYNWGSHYLNVSNGFLECAKTGIYAVTVTLGYRYTGGLQEFQRYIWTKLRSSNTPLHSMFLPYLDGQGADTWYYQGLPSMPVNTIVRLETGQGIGLWCLKDSDDVTIAYNLQCTRLSDG